MVLDYIIEQIARETQIRPLQVKAVVQLLDESNTVPFISRYRKEITGGLDEIQIRAVQEILHTQRVLEKRKEEVIRLIQEQGLLTDDLTKQIQQASKMVEVEDIYLPFRPKRKTRASSARERGLQALADFLMSFPRAGDATEEALAYISEAVPSIEDALQGAMDIVAEQVAEDAAVRKWVREHTRRHGSLSVAAKNLDQESPYRMYYQYEEPVAKTPPHRILAINRGEREEILRVAIMVDASPIIERLQKQYVKTGVTSLYVNQAIQDSYIRLIKPAVERDLRREMTEKAEIQAIQVFAANLKNLLLQPPVKGQTILGLDPAYRTGCKWAVVDDTGKLLEVGVIYPTPPLKKVAESEAILEERIKKYGVTAIVIGNGTASRETEQFVAGLIQNRNLAIPYTIVSEAGASVYSASRLAAAEFPGLDVSQRSAVSIARRLQDPLAELVKIEPQAIGVGQYQHDLPPKELEQHLTNVVESAVNQVGVELNTASASLLGYVSGLSKTVAQNIVGYREENGRFGKRRDLLKVAKLGPKAFEQAAGFLRIYDGENPLDATAIHPESYSLALALLQLVSSGIEEIGQPVLADRIKKWQIPNLAESLQSTEPTLKDVIDCLLKPHRDPREDLPLPVFRTDVLNMEDLRPGMILTGTVRNVVDFGAFVDIGVKTDGLVHLSQMADRFIRHPMEVVALGDVVSVRVLEVDRERQRVSLSMKVQ